jgi:competence protein ComEC
MCALEIYVLNVGQGDTAILKTPRGNLVVIDAYRPSKVKDALETISDQRTVSHLIVTHPHLDHYNAANRLLETYSVQELTLAPFWHYAGTPMYHEIINTAEEKGIPLHFLGGYQRSYPDGGTFPDYEGDLYLELLGPPNNILDELDDNNLLTPNHLSIMIRLRYRRFSMALAADAQMENWSHYDREGMLAEGCNVLKAAHHGSKRGTQFERLERLAPELVIVSSELTGTHHLPDLIGSVIFLEYDTHEDQEVALTGETGTIKITVEANGQYDVVSYREEPDDPISGLAPGPLPQTDWGRIVADKVPA